MSFTREEKDQAVRERDEWLNAPPLPRNVWRRLGGAIQLIYAPERGRDVILSVKRTTDGDVWFEMVKLNENGVGITEVTQVILSSDLAEELGGYVGKR